MATTPWESDLAKELKERFADQITELSSYLGQNFLVCKPDAAIPILDYLKLEADFDYLVDITAVDYPNREERFDLIYVLYSFARNERLRVKALLFSRHTPAQDVACLSQLRKPRGCFFLRHLFPPEALLTHNLIELSSLDDVNGPGFRFQRCCQKIGESRRDRIVFFGSGCIREGKDQKSHGFGRPRASETKSNEDNGAQKS